MSSLSHACGKKSRGSDSESDDETSGSGVIARVKRRNIQDSLMEKDDLRIAAVKRDDVEALARLSDETKWYEYIEPSTGDTLLHIAVDNRRKQIFDYFLAIDDVPVNYKNNKGHTVLNLCFYPSVRGHPLDDYFACELIKKGNSVDSVHLECGDTLLHLAISREYVKVSELLMSMGYDLNARDKKGLTPLWKCLHPYLYTSQFEDRPTLVEIVSALLCHGADPTGPISKRSKCYNAFEELIQRRSRKYHHLHKLLFDFLIDDSIHFEIILLLAIRKSALFRDAAERAQNIIVKGFVDYVLYLFELDNDDLDFLIKKCPDAIREAFSVLPYACIHKPFCMKRFIENANIFLESDLRDDTIYFMRRFWGSVTDRTPFEKNESVALSFACFLLSYGLELKEQHLIKFYKAYGYGESFKILLHMEIDTKCSESDDPYRWAPFGLLLYDVNCDLEQILNKSEKFSLQDVEQLVYYFSNAKLRTLCGRSGSAAIVATMEKQSDVPLLSELARNVFRKYLIRRFNVAKANQFYTLVNRLHIPSVHKKIITFETKLY